MNEQNAGGRRDIQSIDALADCIYQRLTSHDSKVRLIVGIAGAPGSGKSTLAQQLESKLDELLDEREESAVVVPMDGYHLDNVILDAHGSRSVKGSPSTFDVDGFVNLIARLRVPSDRAVYVPVFDRSADLARNAAQEVNTTHSIVLVEGNYLLLEREPWSELGQMFDMSIMLDVPFNVLEQRLIQRWLDHGHSAEEARTRALANDLPNAQVVVAESTAAHIYFSSVRQ